MTVSACVEIFPDFGDAPAEVCGLVPGECLKSNKLICTRAADAYLKEGKLIFSFVPDLDCELNRVDRKFYNKIPSDGFFGSFGEKSAIVKREYKKRLDSYNKKYRESNFNFHETDITILYNGGFSLIANTDFAGVPAGEELAGLMEIGHLHNRNVNHFIDPGFTLDYEGMLVDGFSFEIPVGDFSLVGEHVKFLLKVPVKVVYYLHWLYDLTEDPNAPVLYKDEVLTCSFVSSQSLK